MKNKVEEKNKYLVIRPGLQFQKFYLSNSEFNFYQ